MFSSVTFLRLPAHCVQLADAGVARAPGHALEDDLAHAGRVGAHVVVEIAAGEHDHAGVVDLGIRRIEQADTAGQEMARTLCVGGIDIDTENLSGSKEGVEINFTKREIEVLSYLAQHGDRAVSREELLSKVWGYARNLDIETRTVDIHIAKLRRKIETDNKAPERLITVRGAGYRLVVER